MPRNMSVQAASHGITVHTCVWQAAPLTHLFPHKGGYKLLFPKLLMLGSSISESSVFPSMLNLLTLFHMSLVSLLLPPLDSAQLPRLTLWLTCVSDLTTASCLNACFVISLVCPWSSLTSTGPSTPNLSF